MTPVFISAIIVCVTEDQAEGEALTVALDHAWRWYELRVNSALQIINYYLIAAAVTSAAYVSALNARRYFIAGMIAIIASAISVGAYSGGHRQQRISDLAIAPIREIEGRLADLLDIDSLRMIQRFEAGPKLRLPFLQAHILYPVGVIVGVAGAVYAWVWH